MLTKTCRKCGKEFPNTRQYFMAGLNGSTGSYCRPCRKAYKKMREANPAMTKTTYETQNRAYIERLYILTVHEISKELEESTCPI